MSIEAMNWALSQSTGSPAAKCVLIVLANRAHPTTGECFPGIDGIAEQTELSGRSVIRQIKNLTERGLVSVKHRGGTGEGRKSNVYQLHIGGLGANLSHRGNVTSVQGQSDICAGQCDTVSPEPKDKPKDKPKERERARRIPDDFELTAERRAVAEAEKVPADRTFASFRDYWSAASGQKARKHDWDATWRIWCRREGDSTPKVRTPARKTKYEEMMERMQADIAEAES